jgi:hypothetical protein
MTPKEAIHRAAWNPASLWPATHPWPESPNKEVGEGWIGLGRALRLGDIGSKDPGEAAVQPTLESRRESDLGEVPP